LDICCTCWVVAFASEVALLVWPATFGCERKTFRRLELRVLIAVRVVVFVGVIDVAV
jgi:hypothetical protein